MARQRFLIELDPTTGKVHMEVIGDHEEIGQLIGEAFWQMSQHRVKKEEQNPSGPMNEVSLLHIARHAQLVYEGVWNGLTSAAGASIDRLVEGREDAAQKLYQNTSYGKSAYPEGLNFEW